MKMQLFNAPASPSVFLPANLPESIANTTARERVELMKNQEF